MENPDGFTVILTIDLTQHDFGDYDSLANKDFLKLQETLSSYATNTPKIQKGELHNFVLELPNDERMLGKILYFLDLGHFPYQTRYLREVFRGGHT